MPHFILPQFLKHFSMQNFFRPYGQSVAYNLLHNSVKHGFVQHKSANTPFQNTDRFLIYSQACMWTNICCETNSVKHNTQ